MTVNETLELQTESETQTRDLGFALGQVLRAGDLISLTGDLGAGKTRFVQGIGAGLGITEPITSPTFTIIKLYEGRLPLYHFDVYRLLSARELEPLGYEEYFFGAGATVVEWGDKVSDRFPADHLRIEIHRDLELPERRHFVIEATGQHSRQLLPTLAGTV